MSDEAQKDFVYSVLQKSERTFFDQVAHGP